MASLQFFPPTTQLVTTSLVDLVAAPPANFMDIFNVRATIISGTADAYIHFWSEDTVASNDGWITWNEPVRYAVPGGSPDILVGYGLYSGYKLQVQGSANSVINVHVYNRVRKQIS